MLDDSLMRCSEVAVCEQRSGYCTVIHVEHYWFPLQTMGSRDRIIAVRHEHFSADF